jgi:hypothetical protein
MRRHDSGTRLGRVAGNATDMRTEYLLDRGTANSSAITHGSCYCSCSAAILSIPMLRTLTAFAMRAKHSTFAILEVFVFL